MIALYLTRVLSASCGQRFFCKKKRGCHRQPPLVDFINLLLLNNVSGLRSTSALLNVISNSLTFFERLETFTLNSGEMYEYILSVFACDEAIALFSIEPLYSTLVHCVTSIKMMNKIVVVGSAQVFYDTKKFTDYYK